MPAGTRITDFISLGVVNGTHVLFGTQMAGYDTSEGALCEAILPRLTPGMLVLADRNFFSYQRWQTASATGADLLWRVKKNLILPCMKRFEDGSYLSKISGELVRSGIEYTAEILK